jgi:hypothetical protein
MTAKASGFLLTEGARFSESVSSLSHLAYMPKGVYRYRSHGEANQHDQECLVRAMGALAIRRRNG